MKIRGKLLLLLLAVALVPLGISAFLHYASMNRFGRHLAAGWRQSLTVSAHDHLTSAVDNFRRLQANNEAALELALRIQARETERLLDSWSLGRRMPSTRDKEAGKARLTELYRSLDKFSSVPGIRRLVVLNSGIQAAYPAENRYSVDDDLRRQGWYLRTGQSRQTTWELIPGVKGLSPLMIMATPLRYKDGFFAGITALEVPLHGWLEALRLPSQWSTEAEKLLVVFDAGGSGGAGVLRVVGRGQGKEAESPSRDYLEADFPSQTASVLADIRVGRSGVRLVRYRGEETHWIYGAHKGGRPFPVITIPHQVIIAQAQEAERHVQEKTAAELKTTGLTFLGVIAAIIVVAFAVARQVTRPLNRLAQGAERLATGDYEARVEIRTGDEFQEVGEVFNALGPKLRERERMARSLAIAQEIQQRLLPQGPPRLAGFDISAQSFFCEETGGDYYDFIELAGERLGVAVGDVSGHGIGAALLMTAARGVLRSYAGLEGGDPGTLFKALNGHLIRDVGDQEFMTLFYAEIDGANRSLRWSSAGHGPVFHYQKRTGEVKELPATGIPLGIVAEGSWELAGPVPLEVGDILLVGTDGLWETRNQGGEMFGHRRMREVLQAQSKESAAGVCAAVMDRVHDFRAGGRLEDDVTLVVVRARDKES